MEWVRNLSIDTDASTKPTLVNCLLFAGMGAGANWVLPTVLFQEIPYFQNHMPEKLCISTYMNASVSMALVVTLTFVLYNHYVRHIPNAAVVPKLLQLSLFATFAAAMTYPYVVGGISLFLFITIFLGGVVGSVSSVVMNPYMTRYRSVYISAARGGGSAAILLCAVLGLIQSPGTTPLFSPRIFILIFACLFVIPIISHWYITKHNIGIKPHENEDTDTDTTESGFQLNPISQNGKDLSLNAAPTNKSELYNDDAPNSMSVFTNFYISEHFAPCIPYMLSVGWVSFNTWGMLSAVTPFAMEYASRSHSGSFHLALAYELAAIGLVAGDFSTAVFKLHFRFILPIFTIFACTIYLAALKAPGFAYEATAPLLIITFSLGRFLEAHIVTSSYRFIATSVPLKHREIASRCVGVAEQVSTVLGVILSTVLVSQLAEC